LDEIVKLQIHESVLRVLELGDVKRFRSINKSSATADYEEWKTAQPVLQSEPPFPNNATGICKPCSWRQLTWRHN